MRIFALFLAALAIATALPASAGQTYSSIPQAPLKIGTERLVPHRGGYWNPAEPGSGYFVDVMPRGNGEVFAFATAYTYTATGQSTFLILQGNLTFATETQRQQEGWIAKLVSPTYEARDGQPFGGVYQPANVTPSSFGGGELVWSTRRTAELRVGGRTTPIRILHPDDAATEAAGLLSGTWVVQVRQRGRYFAGVHPSFERFSAQVVRLTPSVPQPAWTAGNGAAAAFPGSAPIWLPPADVITFTPTCVSECLPMPVPQFAGAGAELAGAGARIWIDPVTMRAGWVRGAIAQGQSDTTARVTQAAGDGLTYTHAFDLYVDDDKIVGRGVFVSGDNANPNLPAGSYPGSEIVMTRISADGLHAPEGTVVKIY